MILVLFYIVHVIISLFLIGVVLLQQGKGADLSVFGGGSTMTAFGSRSATNILHRLTVGAFIAFMVTTLSIGVLQRSNDGSTVMADVPATDVAADGEATSQPAADAAADTSGELTDGASGDSADLPAATDDAATANDSAAAEAGEAASEGDTTPEGDAAASTPEGGSDS